MFNAAADQCGERVLSESLLMTFRMDALLRTQICISSLCILSTTSRRRRLTDMIDHGVCGHRCLRETLYMVYLFVQSPKLIENRTAIISASPNNKCHTHSLADGLSQVHALDAACSHLTSRSPPSPKKNLVAAGRPAHSASLGTGVKRVKTQTQTRPEPLD